MTDKQISRKNHLTITRFFSQTFAFNPTLIISYKANIISIRHWFIYNNLVTCPFSSGFVVDIHQTQSEHYIRVGVCRYVNQFPWEVVNPCVWNNKPKRKQKRKCHNYYSSVWQFIFFPFYDYEGNSLRLTTMICLW